MKIRKNLLWLILVIVVFAALAMARVLNAPVETSGGRPGTAQGGKAGGGRNEPKRPEVSVTVMQTEPLSRKVLSSGTLLAHEEVELKSEIADVSFPFGSRKGPRSGRAICWSKSTMRKSADSSAKSKTS